MNTVSPANPDRAERMLAALVTYVDEHHLDARGHLRTALLAVLLADRHDLAPAEAMDLAVYDAFDERVIDAGVERDRLLAEARKAQLAAEYDETPAAVA